MAQFTNQASISYNGIVANSNIVTGQITQVITVLKDATVNEYHSDEILTYIINIHNSGNTEYTGLTITDDLGAYTFGTGKVVPLTYTGDSVRYYINGTLQETPTVTAGPPLVIDDIRIPAGGSGVIVYRVAVNEYAPFGTDKKIDNTVKLGGGGLTESPFSTKTVNASNDVSLRILKALNPTTVVENGQVTYTFTIQNDGTTAADTEAAIVVNDTFNPPLAANPTVLLNGNTWPDTNYSYTAATGVFRTVAGQLTVPAAQFKQNVITGVWEKTPGVTTLVISGTI